jgi:hypothetical protein
MLKYIIYNECCVLKDEEYITKLPRIWRKSLRISNILLSSATFRTDEINCIRN